MSQLLEKIIDLIRNHPDQVNALAAVSALFVSFMSIVLTVWALWWQRLHNFKSLTPIASVGYWDYENLLLIKLQNSGVGPLIIEQVTVTRGDEQKDNVIGWMPADLTYTDFTSKLKGTCISPNQEIVLLEFRGNQNDANFILNRNRVREALSTLVVNVKYRDIYDRKMKDENESFAWFGRHLLGAGREQPTTSDKEIAAQPRESIKGR